MKKKITCQACEGRGWFTRYSENESGGSSWNENCAECNGTGEVEVPFTRGDLWRSFDNKMLANMMSKLMCNNCHAFFNCAECHVDDEGCATEILKYFNEEAPDDQQRTM